MDQNIILLFTNPLVVDTIGCFDTSNDIWFLLLNVDIGHVFNYIHGVVNCGNMNNYHV